jgi:two-component system LytT family sensor kinase
MSPRQGHIWNRISIFWRLQLVGWGLYSALYFTHLFLFREYTAQDLARISVGMLLGFLITCSLRFIYKRTHLISRSILTISLIVIISSLLGAVIWLLGFRMIWGTLTQGWRFWTTIALSGPVVRTVIPIFFDMVLLTSWSALYFIIKISSAWNEQIEKANQAREKAHNAQLQMIYYQLNPHFLFNALNAIRALINEDKILAKQLITDLSEFLRYSLVSKEDTIIPLAHEIEAVRQYLSIEQRRYEDKLNIYMDVEPSAAVCPVISFIIYPLAENAIKHGLKSSPLPLRIRIKARMADDALKLTVSNTGKWIEASEQKHENGLHGLFTLKQRLENHYQNRFQFLTEEKNGWIHVKLEIYQILNSNYAESLQRAHS